MIHNLTLKDQEKNQKTIFLSHIIIIKNKKVCERLVLKKSVNDSDQNHHNLKSTYL